jgi:hypothetical protein
MRYQPTVVSDDFSSLAEAEFQARFRAAVKKALPYLPADVRLERHLQFKLGHHQIAFDGLKPIEMLRGRYDMLVIHGEKPLLLAELKAPSIPITPDDVQQGLSYARLHVPPVPLLIATNGEEHELRRVYDGAKLDATIPTHERLAEILGQSAALAAASTDDAIRTLLGSAPESWQRIFCDWTSETIAELTGAPDDFRKPIVANFSFPREVEPKIEEKLRCGAAVIVLHAPPISGVTNTLAHLARAASTGPRLFMQTQTPVDVLQTIANRLTTELNVGISKDDLRAWFGSLRGLLKITLFLDGFPTAHAEELLDWARRGQLQIVFGMHSEARRQAVSLPGRNQSSSLGTLETPVELGNLSDAEFEAARTSYRDGFTAEFAPGAETAPNLRSVRSHRIIAALLTPKQHVPPGANSVIPTFSGPQSLAAYDRAFVTDPALRADFQQLANVFLKEASNRYRKPDWSLTWGMPSLDPQLAQAVLGRPRLQEFVSFGFLSWVDHSKLGSRILVRVEEIFAHYVAEKWATELTGIRKVPALRRKMKSLTQLAFMVPEGDTALAAAICRAGLHDTAVLSVCVSWLLSEKPTKTRLKTGRKLQMLLRGQDVTLHLGEGMDEEATGNLFPWMVLSRCAFWPMAVTGSAQSGNFLIFSEVGNCPTLIRPLMHQTLQEHRPINMHAIDGVGQFVCSEVGIVEPLVAAMVEYARSEPDEFRQLAQHAVDESKVHLIWRIHNTAATLERSNEAQIATMAVEIRAKMKSAFTGLITNRLGIPPRVDERRGRIRRLTAP